ncbi:MAG: sterol desaturase family protein [Elusimicrobia bacterium]|nr:sterol desaturase family protein [Elusimicrobiota bacterium]
MTIALMVGAVAALMAWVEAKRPGQRWPEIAGWWTRAALLNGAQVAVVYFLSPRFDRFFETHRLFTIPLGPVAGALFGYLILTFVFYWWHRARHGSDFLWRWFHQIHHSASRIEVITSFYKHPLEIAADGAICSLVTSGLLGLSLEASAGAVLLSGLAELVYHWNVSTPHWLGFFFQRPESHRLHHQKGVHAYNYGDLPLWDMLFGTFRNPVRWDAECGLGLVEEERLGEMLAGIDVLDDSPKTERTRVRRLGWAMAVLGLAQIAGDLSGVTPLKALAAATAASPAPKVFCTAKGLETFSTRFRVEWREHGRLRSRAVGPGQRMRGPYNRRNVYGAALSYGPVLPETLRGPVLEKALCGSAPLLREMGERPGRVESAAIVYEPRRGTPSSVSRRVEVRCR